MRKIFFALAAFTLFSAAAPVEAATFDFTIFGPAASLGGFSFPGSGVLTTGAAGANGGELVTSISGEIGGVKIDTVLPTGSFESNSNFLYPTGGTVLDTAGLAFSDVAGDKFDVFSFYAQGSTVVPGNNYGEISTAGSFGVGTFAVTSVSAVPLPAALPMLGMAVAGLAGLGLSRRKQISL